MEAFQREVGEWAEATFPKATDNTIAVHLGREVAELRAWTAASERGYGPVEEDSIAAEAADCLLLLLHLAHRCGFDLLDVARWKLAQNRARTWGQPDAEGVVSHVKEG